MISKANYPVFLTVEYRRVGDSRTERLRQRWVHLRICQTCGKMLCCDSSKNQHARHHYEESRHAVISSADLGEQWLWCFADE